VTLCHFRHRLAHNAHRAQRGCIAVNRSTYSPVQTGSARGNDQEKRLWHGWLLLRLTCALASRSRPT